MGVNGFLSTQSSPLPTVCMRLNAYYGIKEIGGQSPQIPEPVCPPSRALRQRPLLEHLAEVPAQELRLRQLLRASGHCHCLTMVPQ